MAAEAEDASYRTGYNSMNSIKSVKDITAGLIALQDLDYRDFHSKLMPTVPKEKIIGVRTPELRKYAKELVKNTDAAEYINVFLNTLPHDYYEENNLHGALLALLFKDVNGYLEMLERFLPYVDNWATCDMMGAKVFKKDLDAVHSRVEEWIRSPYTYTVRFAVVTLMSFFLDEAFDEKDLELVSGILSDEYYVKMAVAWYFSIALIKQYDKTIPYFTTRHLDIWTHNKALQKARESFRLDNGTKEYLKTLKIK